MRRAGLALRFILLTSLLILTTSATISLFGLWKYEKVANRESRERGITLARNVAYNSELGVLTRNSELLREIATGIFQEADVVRVSVTDVSGQILLEENRDGTMRQDLRALTEPGVIPAGAGNARVTPLAANAGGRAELIEVAYPVFTRRGTRSNEEIGFLLEEKEASDRRLETVGEVRLYMTLEERYADLSRLRWAFGGLTMAVIFIGVLLTILLVRIVVKPIMSLVEATRRIASGSLEEMVQEGSHDELGELARSFNQMTAELKKSRRELERYSADLEDEVRLRTKELEEAQSQLVQAEKMSAVGLLVSGVAHELNNPLAGVVGFSQLLLREDVAEKVRRGLERINREAERCKKIVQNLQTFARKHKPQKDYVGVNGILESCIELRAYQLRVDNIKVLLELAPQLPKTMADFHQLQQVFINILVNAHQAMVSYEKEGQIIIRTSHRSGTIRVEIQDSGPGISESNLPKLFDPFFTTKEVGQGTGLGLSICYGIIEEHHGTISALNAAGHGAVFRIELPIVEPAEPEVRESVKPPALASQPAIQCGSILVVDDEMTIVDILYQLLKADGHRVDTAMSGSVALRKLTNDHYDVIISDLKMPGMSGQELYKQVASQNSALARRIIFSTGDVVSTETREFLESCGNTYLQKPFEIEMIRQAVMAAMRNEVLQLTAP